MLFPEFEIGIGDFTRVAVFDDFAVFDKNGAVAELADIFHGMGDEDDGLVAVSQTGEVIVAFFLEGGVADGKNFVEEQDVTASANSDGKGEANLHTAGVVFEFLILEIFELGEFPNVVVHGVHFFVAKSKQCAIQINIFATGELGVETDAKFDKWDEIAIDGDGTLLWVVDAGEDF